eukprot:11215582-Lingulodinium_polyedra.AAC.1
MARCERGGGRHRAPDRRAGRGQEVRCQNRGCAAALLGRGPGSREGSRQALEVDAPPGGGRSAGLAAPAGRGLRRQLPGLGGWCAPARVQSLVHRAALPPAHGQARGVPLG